MAKREEAKEKVANTRISYKCWVCGETTTRKVSESKPRQCPCCGEEGAFDDQQS